MASILEVLGLNLGCGDNIIKLAMDPPFRFHFHFNRLFSIVQYFCYRYRIRINIK
jgi:hypothetical protein